MSKTASDQVGPKNEKNRPPGKRVKRGRLHFTEEEVTRQAGEPTSGQVAPKPASGGKFRQDEEREKPSSRLRQEDEARRDTAHEEQAAQKDKKDKQEKKKERAEAKAEHSAVKLEAAKEKLAQQKPQKPPGLPQRAATAAGAGVWAYTHRKTGMMNAVVGTSYTAEDEDILGANEDYTALENELRQKIANIERTHPGYDEYRYNVDELGHNPYELTSYLIAKLRTYTRENVQSELRALFEAQYKLTLTEEVEIRYRTETDTWTDEDGNTHTDTYEVPYEYYILHVRLQNKTLPVVVNSLLDAEQKEIYDITLELKGNKPYLWDDIYTGGGGSYDPRSDYTVPGEALSDPAFAALITEAEKYLGWPYVWGGSSPSTSFDCSGFVCCVYTASGVHNLPRTTATGIFNQCAYVSPADARPGDLIFFTKTYNCDGPVSHVGIYVGDGMMIHAGDPIKYASINTNYWQEHFYAFGRIF